MKKKIAIAVALVVAVLVLKCGVCSRFALYFPHGERAQYKRRRSRLVQAFFNERVTLMLTVHKSGKIREVSIIVVPSGDDAVDANNLLLARDAYLKVIDADGSVTTDDKAKVRDDLKLALPPLELPVGVSTIVGGKLYSTVELPLGVAFCIGEQ